METGQTGQTSNVLVMACGALIPSVASASNRKQHTGKQKTRSVMDVNTDIKTSHLQGSSCWISKETVCMGQFSLRK